MTSVVGLVQNTTCDLSSSQLQVPPFIWGAVTILNKVHYYWRWMRAAEVYGNPDNLMHLMGGHALKWALGDNALVRIAAQSVMICNRIILSVEAYNTLARACRRWTQVCWHRPLKRRMLHHPLPYNEWISPSTALWLRFYVQPLLNRITKVFLATWQVITGMFELSMRIMDTVDAFALSPVSTNDGLNEIFVNTSGCINTLANNKENLLISLKEQRSLIEKILKPSFISFDQLHGAVERCIQTASFVQSATKTTRLVGRSLVTAGRNAICATKNAIQDLVQG